ncbi:MAG: hypothetical protein BMS9Abin01_2618 [Gammaproteobacteria bacterium]|nr:MAG: hypothetical protein BMS9Abin01_2618 [Gammaproteobacteria bacterium]
MKLRPPHSTIVDVTERESAPWITMVHAATHDQRFFSSQVQAFRSDYRLLLIDLPGHGQSASLPGPYGFEEYAASVLAAMDAAGVDQSHYLGSHTGAAVALILACRDARRFRSLALESAPIPGLDLPSVIENYARARATARRSGIEAARAEWLARGPWFAIIRKHPERCRADAHRAMVSEFSARPWLDTTPAQPVTPLLDKLNSIHCPVLIINGEHDVEDFLHAADELERRLPRARRVMISGAGGFPMWEDPQPVNDHIRRHLRDARMRS